MNPDINDEISVKSQELKFSRSGLEPVDIQTDLKSSHSVKSIDNGTI